MSFLSSCSQSGSRSIRPTNRPVRQSLITQPATFLLRWTPYIQHYDTTLAELEAKYAPVYQATQFQVSIQSNFQGHPAAVTTQGLTIKPLKILALRLRYRTIRYQWQRLTGFTADKANISTLGTPAQVWVIQQTRTRKFAFPSPSFPYNEFLQQMWLSCYISDHIYCDKVNTSTVNITTSQHLFQSLSHEVTFLPHKKHAPLSLQTPFNAELIQN